MKAFEEREKEKRKNGGEVNIDVNVDNVARNSWVVM